MYYHNVGMRGSRKIQISKFNIHSKINEKGTLPPPPLSLENISGSAYCWSEEILNVLQYSGSLYSVTVRPSMIDYS